MCFKICFVPILDLFAEALDMRARVVRCRYLVKSYVIKVLSPVMAPYPEDGCRHQLAN